MKQVVQNLKSGKVELKEVPVPSCGAGEVLVVTKASLISAGTERMMMDFAGKSLVGKAKERPDLVKKVMTKISRDGLVDTLKSVFLRLAEPMPLGYSASGTVVQVGAKCASVFQVGDRVAVAGAGLANHAEANAVPMNLAVKLPENLPFEHGCYATLGAIALHGVRNAGVVLGDRVLVLGLGLVGQLVVQLCAAAGARVAALDFNKARCDLALQGGAHLAVDGKDDPSAAFKVFTDGRGFDAILICAATDSDAPLANAAEWARDRATVVLVGKVGTRFDYGAYMKKELNIKISRSYGPGRYDPAFEQQGLAYPVGFVPWTERENLGEVVRLMGLGKLNVGLLTTHTFDLEDSLKAYDMVKDGGNFLGVVLTYKGLGDKPFAEPIDVPKADGDTVVSVMGTGLFARGMLIPNLLKIPHVALGAVVSKGGLSSATVADKHGGIASTQLEDAFTKHTDAVIIATRHNVHASQALKALKAGKHVWVEKPLAMTEGELMDIKNFYSGKAQKPLLMVGFNRRFAPAVLALKAKLDKVAGPRQILVRVNAGRLDESWQHTEEGGGRLLGEVCHFTDLALFLAGSPVVDVQAIQGAGQDNYVVSLSHENGSVSTVFYSSEGDPAAAKERVEVLAGGGIGVMDNYVSTTWSVGGKVASLWARLPGAGTDKGHAAALKAWIDAVRGEDSALPSVAEILASSALVLRAKNMIGT